MVAYSTRYFRSRAENRVAKSNDVQFFAKNPIDELFERIKHPEGDADLQVCLLSLEFRFESVVLQKVGQMLQVLRKGQVTGY